MNFYKNLNLKMNMKGKYYVMRTVKLKKFLMKVNIVFLIKDQLKILMNI